MLIQSHFLTKFLRKYKGFYLNLTKLISLDRLDMLSLSKHPCTRRDTQFRTVLNVLSGKTFSDFKMAERT